MIRSVVLAASLALLATHVQAEAQQPGAKFKDCRDCPEMVVVPAGSFTMGSSDAETIGECMEPDARRREQPARTVTLARPFAIGRFEDAQAIRRLRQADQSAGQQVVHDLGPGQERLARRRRRDLGQAQFPADGPTPCGLRVARGRAGVCRLALGQDREDLPRAERS